MEQVKLTFPEIVNNLKVTAMLFLIFCFVHFLSAIGPLVMVAKYYFLRSCILGIVGS